MINELDTINKLKTVITRDFNSYLADDFEKIEGTNVLIDFPDVDHMQGKTCIYLQPNYNSYETLTTGAERAEQRISVFILAKRDTQSNLTTKVLTYGNALYRLLKENMTLDGTIDFITIESSDYYPSIEGNDSVRGMEISVVLVFMKEWDI